MAETLRDGRFVCHGTLGEGAQGTTFDGVDKREGRAVAIKRFQVRGAKSWKDVELAAREARVLSQLHHPLLPAYVDHFEEGGALYLVMERIEGESLAALRKRGVVIGEEDVVRLLRDASEVLDYLHGRAPQVIHRDLKPGNVIRRPDGSHAFVDFGAVRDKLRPEGGSTVVGTFGYMAPEQFQGRASAGSDVYAIAATAMTMLTGVEPEDLPHKGLGIDVPSALRGRASRPLVEILTRMLEPNPDVRPQRIAPLLAGLRDSARRGSEPAHKSKRDRKVEEARRKSEKWSRRAERAADRAERRGQRHERPSELPWPLLVVLSIGLTLSAIAVWVWLGVIGPALLSILSLLLGPKLREASERTLKAGVRAGAAIERARALVHRRLAPVPTAQNGARVAAAPASRVRVDPSIAPVDDDEAIAETELAEQESVEAKERMKRRGR